MSALELKVPPPAVMLLAAVLMWALARMAPGLDVMLPWRLGLVVIALGLGAFCGLAGIAAFRRARTTANPTTPDAATTVVSDGIYRISRNPMYLGLLLLLIGWACLLANGLAALTLPLFVLYMNRFQIVPEERALQARFGDAYRTYRHAVRRWL